MHNRLAQELNLPVQWIDKAVEDAPDIDATDSLANVAREIISRTQISEFGVTSKPSVYEIKLVVAGYINGNYRGHEEAKDTLQNILETMAAFQAASQGNK